MTAQEKRAYIRGISEPSLKLWASQGDVGALRCLDILNLGTDAAIEQAFKQVFRVGWEVKQKAAMDKAGDAGV